VFKQYNYKMRVFFIILIIVIIFLCLNLKDGLLLATNHKNNSPEIFINVEDFNVDRTGKRDSTLAIKKAITFAEKNRLPVYFPSNGIFKIKDTIKIDISKTSLISNGAILDYTELKSDVAIQLYSTTDYNGRALNTKSAIEGFSIKGAIDPTKKLIGKTGILLGHEQYNASNFTVQHIAIDGFENNIQFMDNAWRISFSHIQSRWGKVYAPAGLTNMGENINFNDCMFSDAGADIELYSGFFHFINTSFDNSTLRLGGSATAHVSSSHFENPNSSSTSKRFVSLESKDSQVFLDDIDIILNKPKNNEFFDSALFYVSNDNKQKGLVMSNINLFQHNYYRPYITDQIATLVAGEGRVQFHGGLNTNINDTGYILAKSLNVILNGDGEDEQKEKWTILGDGQFGIDSVQYKNGSKSLKLTTENRQKISISQDFKVEASQYVYGQYWWKQFNEANLSKVSCKIDFYTIDNKYISTIGYTQNEKNSDWTNRNNITGIVPIGANYARITFLLEGNVNKSELWIDDLIINVL
jgi:hypothetical protein